VAKDAETGVRVLSVCRTLPTPANLGAGVFVFERLRAMSARADLRIIQPVPYCPLLKPLPVWAREPQHVVNGTTIVHQPMFYLPGVMKFLDGQWLARSISSQLRPSRNAKSFDCIDGHFGYPDGVGVVAAARRLGIPAFVTIRGLEADRVRDPLIRPQLISALNAAAGCISVSHSLMALMIDNGVAPDRLVVIPNGIDTRTFCPGSRADAREALGLEPSAPLVVSVGHLISGKRHDVLMRAIARLDGVRLAIVGGPDYEPEYPATLRRLAEQLNLGDRVRFVGAVPPRQVANWLRAADTFALATAREGCCNAILESLATGTPVVSTPVGDNPHYVIDGENGYLIPVDDPAALAAALAAALKRRWDPGRIAATLRVGGWDSVASRVLELFADRLARGAPSAVRA
jgi:teichuronic acid biosynthesis glycosyltransferase TuaC